MIDLLQHNAAAISLVIAAYLLVMVHIALIAITLETKKKKQKPVDHTLDKVSCTPVLETDYISLGAYHDREKHLEELRKSQRASQAVRR